MESSNHPVPRRRHGLGPFILIALGSIFLLQENGVISEQWLHHGWPLILIALGVWQLAKRS